MQHPESPRMPDGSDPQIAQLQAAIDELLSRFRAIEARLDRLESSGSSPAPQTDQPPARPPIAYKATDPPVVSAQRTRDLPLRETLQGISKPSTPSGGAQSPTRVGPPTHPRPKPRPRPAFKRPEWLTGTKGTIFGISLVGVVIFVVGIVWFLKFAYDEGWIQQISPAARCGSAAGFGLLLILGGEFIRRKVSPLASAGASAAGIAIIYASILAAAKMFQILETPTAFVLMAITTLLGIWLGSISKRVVLALFSLLASFLVPILLRTDEPSFVIMPAYLLMLLVIGLVLSGWRGGRYSIVRRVAWWGTGVLGTLWLVDMHDRSMASSLVFVSLAWLATVTELIVSARFINRMRDRVQWKPGSRHGFYTDESGEKRFHIRTLISPEARWINALFGATVWATTAGGITLAAHNPSMEYLAPLVLGVCSIAIGAFVVALAPGEGRILFPETPGPRSTLAAAMVINGVLLGAASIATGLGGWMQVAAWGCTGLAAVETARRIRFRAAGVFGLALIGVAVARLLSYDFVLHLTGDLGTLYRIEALTLTEWSAQIVLICTICAMAAWRSRSSPERSVCADACLWLGALVPLHQDTSPSLIGAFAMMVAVMGAWIGVLRPVRSLRVNAYALCGVGMFVLVLAQFGFDSELAMTPEIVWGWVSVAVICWIGLAALPRIAYESRVIFTGLAMGSGLLAFGSLHDAYGAPEMVLAWAGLLVATTIVGRRFFRWEVSMLSGWGAMVVVVAWLLDRLDTGRSALEGTPFLHLAFASSLVTVILLCVIARRLPAEPIAEDAAPSTKYLRDRLRRILLATAWILLLVTTSIEAERVARSLFSEGAVRGAAVSIWWSVFAVCSIVLGFRYAVLLRWSGLALLALVAVKVLAFDTVVLSPVARVVAFITVGLVIIGAGVIYALLSGRAARKNDGPVETQRPPSS